MQKKTHKDKLQSQIYKTRLKTDPVFLITCHTGLIHLICHSSYLPNSAYMLGAEANSDQWCRMGRRAEVKTLDISQLAWLLLPLKSMARIDFASMI